MEKLWFHNFVSIMFENQFNLSYIFSETCIFDPVERLWPMGGKLGARRESQPGPPWQLLQSSYSQWWPAVGCIKSSCVYTKETQEQVPGESEMFISSPHFQVWVRYTVWKWCSLHICFKQSLIFYWKLLFHNNLPH